MLHVVFVNQYYAPHTSATSQLLTELAEEIAAHGLRVTVITARLEGQPARERRGGVDVRRVRASRRGKGSVLTRLSDYLSFHGAAFAELIRLRATADVVVALSTPPLIDSVAQLAGAGAAYRCVSVVQDLYPDIAVKLGVVPERGPLHATLSAVARRSRKRADAVVVLSERMRERVRDEGVPDARIATIPNWALRGTEHGGGIGDRARLKHGFGDRFVVMYSGNMGAGHTFDAVLDAAASLADQPDILFAIIGEGVRRPAVEQAVRARRLDNVRLLPLAPLEQVADNLAAADVHLITMRDGFDGLLMPSKLYGVLGSGRPAVFVGPARSSVAECLVSAGAGVRVAADDAQGLADHLRFLVRRPDVARAQGEAARLHLDSRYTRDRSVRRYLDLLHAVAAPARAVGDGMAEPGAGAIQRQTR